MATNEPRTHLVSAHVWVDEAGHKVDPTKLDPLDSATLAHAAGDRITPTEAKALGLTGKTVTDPDDVPMVEVPEHVWADADGNVVDPAKVGPTDEVTMLHAAGDLVTEEQAKKAGVRAKKPTEDRAKKLAEDRAKAKE